MNVKVHMLSPPKEQPFRKTVFLYVYVYIYIYIKIAIGFRVKKFKKFKRLKRVISHLNRDPFTWYF